MTAHSVIITPTMQAVQDVNQFDINGEIAALKKAKAERDNAVKNCDGAEQSINAIMQKFENVKKQILENIKNRRRAQYMTGFLITRYGHAWAFPESRSFDADYRLDCPNPEWVLIPGSGHWVENKRRFSGYYCFGKNSIRINNPREENNGYTVHVFVYGGMGLIVNNDKKGEDSYVDFTIAARYRYNDAMIARMLDNDMARFRERIDAALK